MRLLSAKFRVRTVLQNRPVSDPIKDASGGSGDSSTQDSIGFRISIAHGFTLLEVLVSLTVLAVGAALTLSLISGSLGNIRKVQLRTRAVEHAESVMELALLKDQQPTFYSGNFEDGSQWNVRVEDYEPPDSPQSQGRDLPQNMPVKLLYFTVEMFNPDSDATTPDYRLHTLKLVSTQGQLISARQMQ